MTGIKVPCLGSRDYFPLRHHSRNLGCHGPADIHVASLLQIWSGCWFFTASQLSVFVAIHRLDASSSVVVVLRIVFMGFIGSKPIDSSCGHRHEADPFLRPFGAWGRSVVFGSRSDPYRFFIHSSSSHRETLHAVFVVSVQSSNCHGLLLHRHAADSFVNFKSPHGFFFFHSSACSRSFFKPFGMRPKASFFVWIDRSIISSSSSFFARFFFGSSACSRSVFCVYYKRSIGWILIVGRSSS